jgi:hypothetical protein
MSVPPYGGTTRRCLGLTPNGLARLRAIRHIGQGQRISISLNSQYFGEELIVETAPNHLAAETVVDGMALEKAHGESS